MTKTFLYPLGILVFAFALSSCSSPAEKAASYIEQADSFFEQGEVAKAEVQYKNALQINQNLPDAWYGLARIHEDRAEWKQVYSVLNKVRELSPQHVDGRIMLAQLLVTSNQLDQALTDATEILEMAPDDVRARTLMAAVQLRLGNIEASQQEVNKALEIDADHNSALLVQARIFNTQNRYDDALALLNKAIASDPGNASYYLVKLEIYQELNDSAAIEKVILALVDQFPSEIRYKQALARHYVQESNVDAAERVLLQIIEADPENIDYKIDLVEFKRQHESLDEAIELVDSYIGKDPQEYRYQFLLGELYQSGNQNDKAISVYESIIEEDGIQPGGLEARNKIALIEILAGNQDRARSLVNEVLENEGANENALLILSGFQLTDGDYDDAVVSARTVLRDHPDSIKALMLMGQAYDASGSRDLAIESYSRAFEISPGNSAIANRLAQYYMLQRDAAQADKILEESFNNGNRSVEALKLLTQAKLALGEWNRAEQLARQLQKIEGQEAASQELLGVIYLGRQQNEASIEAFKRAYELAPEAEQPLIALVRTYVASGKPDEARQFLNKILEADDSNVNAYMLLGELDLAEGSNADAVKDFRAAIESDPKYVLGYRRLSYAYSQQNQSEKAVQTIMEAIAAVPDDASLVIHLAALYEQNGEPDKAIGLYQDLLEKGENSLIAKNNLANLLVDHRSDQDSLAQAKEIAQEFRNFQVPAFLDTYAWVSVKTGTNLEEAIVILEEIVRENEQVDAYAYHLGEAYRRKGDSSNAITYLQKAIKLSTPGSDISTRAKQALDQLL